MATVRCWALHGNINDAINYVLDVEGDGKKTENKYFECTSGNAYSAGYDWKISSKKLRKSPNEIVGFHFQQSFEAGSITPDEAFELSKKWIEEITKGEYDYVIALHTDTKNIHSHIIVNPINKKTGKNMQIYYKKDLPRFKNISDKICKENGLNVLDHTTGKGKSYYEWMIENQGDSLKQIISKSLDNLINRVSSYAELKDYLTIIGYDVQDDMEKEIHENDFIFTGNIKLVRDTDDSGMIVRLPYTKEYIHVDQKDIVWLKENKTFRISYMNTKPVDILDYAGNVLRTVKAEELNLFWEKKNRDSHKRRGLRIKAPGSSTFIRCNRITTNNEEGYSLSDIIDRIEKNGRLVCDPEIKAVIDKSKLTSSEQIDEKGKFFDAANIRLKWSNTAFYKMTKKERYIAYKTNQIQKKLDAIHEFKEISEILHNLDNMKETLNSLRKDFKSINNDIRRQEKILSDLQNQKMEGTLDISQSELDEFISENITPLYKSKKNLSNKMKEISEKIKAAENKKEKKLER